MLFSHLKMTIICDQWLFILEICIGLQQGRPVLLFTMLIIAQSLTQIASHSTHSKEGKKTLHGAYLTFSPNRSLTSQRLKEQQLTMVNFSLKRAQRQVCGVCDLIFQYPTHAKKHHKNWSLISLFSSCATDAAVVHSHRWCFFLNKAANCALNFLQNSKSNVEFSTMPLLLLHFFKYCAIRRERITDISP